MDANKFVLRQNGVNDMQINLPIEVKWDFNGNDMAIDTYESEVVSKVIGDGYDFELERFPHAPYGNTGKTDINYEFYFFSGGSISASTGWGVSYLNEGFTVDNLYYYENNFTKSFFKLDFYDTVDDKRQTNYITVILPTQQGSFENATLLNNIVEIRKPKFSLDYVGDKEGFFIYWLKDLQFMPINTFYMTAKFYDAKKGVFVKMMNNPQSSIPGDKFSFDATKYFYYRVVFDYVNKSYEINDMTNNQRVGTTTPIKWYQYVNP